MITNWPSHEGTDPDLGGLKTAVRFVQKVFFFHFLSMLVSPWGLWLEWPEPTESFSQWRKRCIDVTYAIVTSSEELKSRITGRSRGLCQTVFTYCLKNTWEKSYHKIIFYIRTTFSFGKWLCSVTLQRKQEMDFSKVTVRTKFVTSSYCSNADFSITDLVTSSLFLKHKIFHFEKP